MSGWLWFLVMKFFGTATGPFKPGRPSSRSHGSLPSLNSTLGAQGLLRRKLGQCIAWLTRPVSLEVLPEVFCREKWIGSTLVVLEQCLSSRRVEWRALEKEEL